MTKFVSAAMRLALVPLMGATLAAGAAMADARVAKDTGPASSACDQLAKGTAGWTACVGQASAQMSDEELFYAGYWLAKNGKYADALSYLSLAKTKDERVLTYIGFATRKMGDVAAALPLYRQALGLNPDYVVARAYLGEAFLTLNDLGKAEAELTEIQRRCGTTCAAYADLNQHIEIFKAQAAKG